MYIRRSIEKSILEAGKSFPCLVVYGPRQVGKSTTVDYLYSDRFEMVTLDDLDERQLAIQNPKLFLDSHPWPVIIDEIQKVPSLLDEIKVRVDAARLESVKNDTPRELMYILTGSNRFELQEGISDSLAGRCGVIDMASLSRVEQYEAEERPFFPEIESMIKNQKDSGLSIQTRHEIFEDILMGGMPDICTGVSDRSIYMKSYVDTYIEKDVKKLISDAAEVQFRSFISVVAMRTACELHYDEIATSVGIDVRTCKRWISILETSGIIYLLQPYMKNLSKRIIKSPKLYFMDTGLCAYLCRWPDAGILENSAMAGAFFETYAVSEIIKNMYAFHVDPHECLYYYRDIDKKEIDLIYVHADELYPIEVKKGIAPGNPGKNFKVLEKFGKVIHTGVILDSCDKIHPLNGNAYYVPISLIGSI